MASSYSFAIKQRPLRRACLASASVVLGASGSESPSAPKKTLSALETLPAIRYGRLVQDYTRDGRGVYAKKLKGHQRAGAVREYV